MVDVELLAVRVELPSNAPVVLLRETSGQRRTVPIFIGNAEAMAIAYALDGVETPRPMTHDLLVTLLSEMKTDVKAVEVTGLDAGTFFAELELEDRKGAVSRVSCRPSDGLAIAARIGCPIRCAIAVMTEAGYEDDDEEEPEEISDPDAVVEEFKAFIEHVNPGDFES